jgi:hypothetical protein
VDTNFNGRYTHFLFFFFFFLEKGRFFHKIKQAINLLWMTKAGLNRLLIFKYKRKWGKKNNVLPNPNDFFFFGGNLKFCRWKMEPGIMLFQRKGEVGLCSMQSMKLQK